MASQPISVTSQPAIWARLIQSQKEQISPEVARYLLAIQFGESDQARMLELADRSEEGTLTPEEKVEFDSYIRIGNLLAIMQCEARMALRAAEPVAHGS